MGKNKPSEEYDQPSEQELLNRLERMPEPYRSYAAFTYLFGNRVSEAIGGTSKYHNKTTIDGIRTYTPLLAANCVIDDLEGWIEVNHVPTLKRRVRDVNKFYRDMIVYKWGTGEEGFVKILEQYLKTKNKEEILWNHHRKTQWLYCNKYLGIPPKVLRSMRAKKDAKQYKLGALELKEKYNWGSVDMPFHYAKFNKEALKNKLKEK